MSHPFHPFSVRQWESIKKIVQKEMKLSPASHGWDHVKRVYDLSLKIGKKEKADLTILGLAALLHDIGRKKNRLPREKSAMPGSGLKRPMGY